MTAAAEFRSGKGHRDENFPVASLLISPEHRAPILAFYEFVRTADDIADHPTLPSAEKLAHLDALEADLLGRGDGRNAVAVRLRAALEERKLAPRHAQDLLAAFRMDVTKLRYRELGRVDRILQPLRDAGRPLRARRAWRAALDLARQ